MSETKYFASHWKKKKKFIEKNFPKNLFFNLSRSH